jgi:hypothetical protein
MRQEIHLHRIVLGFIAIVLLLFFLLTVRVRPSFADEHLEVVGALILVIFAASALIIVGGIEGAIALQFGYKHKVEFATYLTVSVFSLATGLYLGLKNEASLQLLALVVAPHAFLFGLMQLRMAQRLSHHPRFQRTFRIGGAMEIACGIVLIVASQLSKSSETADLIACVGVVSIAQVLPILFLPRAYRKTQVPT